MIDDLEDRVLDEEAERLVVAVPEAEAPCRPTPKRGRFLPNLISNVALFGFNLLIGLWYTPYLIRHLGTGAFGIIPLVSQITGYMIIVTATLNSATGRYITIALEQDNDDEANQYFNTSLFGSMLLVLLLIPLGGLGHGESRKHHRLAGRPGGANPLAIRLHGGRILPGHAPVAFRRFLLLPEPLRSAKHDQSDSTGGAGGDRRGVL